MFKFYATLLLLLLSIGNSFAQSYWKENTRAKRSLSTDGKYRYYSLDRKAFNTALYKATSRSAASEVLIQIPDGNGNLETFRVRKSHILSPALAQQHPEIETYSGVSTTHPDKSVSFTWSPAGLSVVLDQEMQYSFVQPTDTKGVNHKVYHRSTQVEPMAFSCGTTAAAQAVQRNTGASHNEFQSDNKLRTIRVAIAATSDYTKFFGGKEKAFAQIVSTIQRANQIYRSQMLI